MNRTLVLGVLVALGITSIGVSALQQPGAPAQPRVVQIEKLKDNFYVMRGGGGNTSVFITGSGVIVADTKNPGWGQPLLDAIKKVTDRPVTTIVNTHTHGDHVSGNVEFPETVDVVTHVNTAENMKAMRAPNGFPRQPNIFTEHKGRNLAKRTFTDSFTLGSGNDRVELRYFGRGHTNGDAWVFFPALRIVHSGDIFAGKAMAFFDTNNGGSGVEIPDSLSKAAAAMSAVESIVTGHGGVMTVADLREYAQFNREFVDNARAAKQAGRAPAEAATAWSLPAKYTGYTIDPMRVQIAIETIYKELP